MLESLMNPHIVAMEPYASARDEFTGKAEVYLDANESWYGGNWGVNRYPDPRCVELRRKLEEVLGLPFEMTAIGNGSDEIIDMLLRIFCAPGKDSILISRPTYGEYRVLADLNNLETIDVRLRSDLSLDTDAIIRTVKERKPKLVFICTPNNPTGRTYPVSGILRIAKENPGMTVVDEAYSDFSPSFESMVPYIKDNPRIVVMRTMSKAWAMAGARVGIMVSDPELQAVFIKAKAPYNVSLLAQREALKALAAKDKLYAVRDGIIQERARVAEALGALKGVRRVYPSDANFLLVEVEDADGLYGYCLSRGVIIRNRSREPLLKGCLRMTIGSKEENDRLLEVVSGYEV